MIKRMTLPLYMLAITAQTGVAWVGNMHGPGRRPNMINAPSITAVVFEPGTPRANIGTIAPADAALLDDSGPATPSMAPLPKRDGSFATFFSTMYETKVAMVAPAAGRQPMTKP